VGVWFRMLSVEQQDGVRIAGRMVGFAGYGVGVSDGQFGGSSQP
jgi:hypothetical protein